MTRREYHYVGPNAIRDAARMQPTGTRISGLADIRSWLNTAQTDRMYDGSSIATFTITLNEELLVAPRRSEHVACASGGPVLSAGEMTFNDNLAVIEVTNQSTGFCPEPESWASVANSLDGIGLVHPGRFTTEVIFRICPMCRERNVVKDSWYYCEMCGAILPEHWNFTCDENAG
jgi:hypothetical protein